MGYLSVNSCKQR